MRMAVPLAGALALYSSLLLWETHLESLLDLLHEHITIRCKTVHRENGFVRSTRASVLYWERREDRMAHSLKTFGAYRVWML